MERLKKLVEAKILQKIIDIGAGSTLTIDALSGGGIFYTLTGEMRADIDDVVDAFKKVVKSLE